MPTTQHTDGYGLDYHLGRQTKRALAYRLSRRTAEVQRAAEKYGHRPIHKVLDVGTADGLMLQHLQTVWTQAQCVGFDLSHALLLAVPNSTTLHVEADALDFPFPAGTFDLVVATAVIEHVVDPLRMVAECYRVLAKDGLCIITTPDPFFEQIASRIGHLKSDVHNETFRLRQLRQMFTTAGFTVVKAVKFMMSPWGFPAERSIEQIMQAIGLGFILLNQIIVAQKPHAILSDNS